MPPTEPQRVSRATRLTWLLVGLGSLLPAQVPVPASVPAPAAPAVSVSSDDDEVVLASDDSDAEFEIAEVGEEAEIEIDAPAADAVLAIDVATAVHDALEVGHEHELRPPQLTQLGCQRVSSRQYAREPSTKVARDRRLSPSMLAMLVACRRQWSCPSL